MKNAEHVILLTTPIIDCVDVVIGITRAANKLHLLLAN